MKESTVLAVSKGLVIIAPPDKPFKSRNGDNKNYLIDSRGAGSKVELREIIISEMERCLENFVNYDMIGGIAKSGTTWGAWLSWKVRMPFANILLNGKRSSGLQREIEGDVNNKKIVLVDNWLRSGSSVLRASEIVKRNGGDVLGVIVIAKLNEATSETKVFSVWELEELFKATKIVNLVPNNFNFY